MTRVYPGASNPQSTCRRPDRRHGGRTVYRIAL